MEKRNQRVVRSNHYNKSAKSTVDPKEIVFGTRVVMEAIKAGKEINKLLLQRSLSNELMLELTKLAAEYNIPYTLVPVEKLNRVTRKNHQGAICFLSAVTYA